MIQTNLVIDAKGLSCPMPIVRTKKGMDTLEPGQVLEVQATDKGSKVDIQAWANSTGHQYLGTIEEGDVLKHYLRKARSEEQKEDRKHPHVISNDELVTKLADDAVLVDVREPAEYAFGHIPGAKSIPFGELEERAVELDPSQAVYVVCRTGSRSDLAAQQLAAKGFAKVYNIVPGMSGWKGDVASL